MPRTKKQKQTTNMEGGREYEFTTDRTATHVEISARFADRIIENNKRIRMILELTFEKRQEQEN